MTNISGAAIVLSFPMILLLAVALPATVLAFVSSKAGWAPFKKALPVTYLAFIGIFTTLLVGLGGALLEDAALIIGGGFAIPVFVALLISRDLTRTLLFYPGMVLALYVITAIIPVASYISPDQSTFILWRYIVFMGLLGSLLGGAARVYKS